MNIVDNWYGGMDDYCIDYKKPDPRGWAVGFTQIRTSLGPDHAKTLFLQMNPEAKVNRVLFKGDNGEWEEIEVK